jgi:hypothetical protein
MLYLGERGEGKGEIEKGKFFICNLTAHLLQLIA